MPSTVMVRARPETRDRLRELAKAQGTTAIELLERLVRDYQDRLLLDAIATLPPPSGDERTAWDQTLMDGLDPAEDFSSWR
ncbi:MAG: hypothetical protein AB7G37_01220 [Solirubrobacteraceae bacterium]